MNVMDPQAQRTNRHPGSSLHAHPPLDERDGIILFITKLDGGPPHATWELRYTGLRRRRQEKGQGLLCRDAGHRGVCLCRVGVWWPFGLFSSLC